METSENTELAAVGRELRAVFVADPDPEVTDAHLAAILAEAERVAAAGADRTSTPWRGRRLAPRAALAVRLAAVVASAFVASAGLALAGVRPPEPFSDLFEGIGFDVPGSDRATSDAAGESGDTPALDGSGPGPAPPGAEQSQAGAQAAGADAADQRSTADEQAAEGRTSAENEQDDGERPRDPVNSEDHAAAEATSPSPIEAGTAEQTGSGGPPGDGSAAGSEDESSAGGGEEAPAPLIDPTPKPEAPPPGDGAGAGAHGLAVSAEERPVESPGQPPPRHDSGTPEGKAEDAPG